MNAITVKIFISGYPQDYDELALVQLVSPYGQVSTIKIVRDKQSGKTKGYAFVEMVSRAAAEQVAIALDGVKMKNKTLTVNIVEEQPAPAPHSYQRGVRSGQDRKRKRPGLSR